MPNVFIGDPGLACPWCGKPFKFNTDPDGWISIICPNSYCLIVPYGRFATREDAEAALRDRVTR